MLVAYGQHTIWTLVDVEAMVSECLHIIEGLVGARFTKERTGRLAIREPLLDKCLTEDSRHKR